MESDDIPAALYERVTPSQDTPAEPIGRTAFFEALQEYYVLRGWSREGVPGEAKLAALDIDVRLPSEGSLSTRGLPRAK